MELVTVNHIEDQLIAEEEVLVSNGNFIEAGTQQVSLHHLKTECLTPFYSDNMPSISHAEFINATSELVHTNFPNVEVFQPNIKISHTMQGRVAAAIGKSIKELTPEEKTIYYQRLAFMIELPTLTENVNNNSLSLVVGGVRALNKENLFSKKGLERFQVFIGFKNFVCTNLCISTDGLMADIRVSSVAELKQKIHKLISSFDKDRFLGNMERMNRFHLNELQFAHTIGKMKLYQYLNKTEKVGKLALLMNDNQISTVVKNYYRDENFSRSNDREINFWSFYNLMTDANKSSYIDSNLERNVNAFEFISGLANAMQNQEENWFLDPTVYDNM
jgi:hypothetical protein